MSGLEQRTRGRAEALADGALGSAALPEWSVIDGDLLDERRAAVPAFPVDLLPQPWPAWVSAAARSADAPADYVAQAVLATAAGVSGARVWVCVSKGLIEPLRLWLAAVGAPSTGKSPALGLVRRLLAVLEQEMIEGPGSSEPRIVLTDSRTEDVVTAMRRARHGKVLWRDGPDGCFTPLAGMTSARHLENLMVSMLGSVEPDGAALAMQRGGDSLAARFLYAWPHPAPFRPFADRTHPNPDEVLAPLRRLLRLSLRNHCALLLDKPAAAAFEAFLAGLHGEVRQAEGLEAAWLGKGRGAVACLAGLFTVMTWAATEATDPPRHIGVQPMQRAISLWSDYFRPHARAFLHGVAPTDLECQARRVVRWLRSTGRASVSRTEVRSAALARSVDARGADRVVSRLVEAGVLQPIVGVPRARRGRPALSWHVNPMLAQPVLLLPAGEEALRGAAEIPVLPENQKTPEKWATSTGQDSSRK